jgi:hypothetical protein
MMQKQRHTELRYRFSLVLFLLCLISFIPLINQLGYYWDDWPSIWFLHGWGPASFRVSFAGDRPLLAWVFILTTSLLGESPLAWQLFAVFMRFLLGLALWWTLIGLWPDHKPQVAWIVFLFTVYPGFSQQYIAVTYGNGFLVFVIFILSLGLMVWAFRKPTWFWTLYLISFLLSALTIFTVEYFFGLELMRPVLIWLLLRERFPNPIKRSWRAFLFTLPYLSFMSAFAWQRLFIRASPRAAPILLQELRDDPGGALRGLLKTIASDFWEVSFRAWWNKLPALGSLETLWPYIGIVLGAVSLTFLYLLYLARSVSPAENQPSPGTNWSMQAIVVGIWTFMVCGWPVWLTQLKISLLFPFDRFTLITMLSTAILLGGLIGMLSRRIWIGPLAIGILVGVSVGAQYLHRLDYLRDWDLQKSFFWQLAWRVPGIEPGSILFTSEIPFHYSSDNSLTAPLNWMYAHQSTSPSMPYLLYDVELRQKDRLPNFLQKDVIEKDYRLTYFKGSTSQAIVFSYSPPRCLKVIDPTFDRKLPDQPRYFQEMQSKSRPELILLKPDQPAQPPSVFGLEAAHDWCYYFEKADLARQMGDWRQIADLGDQAFRQNPQISIENASELEPFIFGYAQIGDWKKAEELTLQAYRVSGELQSMLCRMWRFIQFGLSPTPEQQSTSARVSSELQCEWAIRP